MNRRVSKRGVEEYRLSSAYEGVISMIKGLKSYQQPLAGKVIRNRLSNMSSREWQQLFQGTEIDFPYDEMEGILSAFYEEICDTYFGVDSNPPSEFITKIHPYLLRSLTSNLQKAQHLPEAKYCYGRHLVRILPISVDDLQADLDNHFREFQDYLSYHTTASGAEHITLLWVDPDYAKKARDDHNLGTTDMGLWIRNCALLFQPGISKEKKIKLQLVCANAEDVEQQNLFRSCVAYVTDLINKAKRLSCNKQVDLEDLDEELREDLNWCLGELVQPQLAKAWYRFVNADRRMDNREGNVLKEFVLGQYKRPVIFDAASGVGAESVWLKLNGYNDVTSNEIVWEFIEQAKQHARDKGVTLQIWNYDWRHLQQKAPANRFDVVLVLGNSLTCLISPDEMKRCISGFHHILKPRGRLVIDSRNYQYMVDHPVEMRRRNYRFRHDVVYPSDEIKAKPKEITSVRAPMHLEYYDDSNWVGIWEVYAYEEDELKNLLEEDDLFEVEHTFWDFLVEPDKENPAEFITYIAVKK